MRDQVDPATDFIARKRLMESPRLYKEPSEAACQLNQLPTLLL